MRIAIIGQQKFGKAAFDAFIERGDTRGRGVLRAGKARQRARSFASGRRAAGFAGYLQLPSLKGPEAIGALREPQSRSRRHGLCAAVRPAGVRRHPEATGPFSSIPRCCRAIGDRAPSIGPSSAATLSPAHHIQADRRPRRGARHSAEADADRPGRHPGQRLFRAAVSHGDRRAPGSGGPGRERPRHRHGARRIACEL